MYTALVGGISAHMKASRVIDWSDILILNLKTVVLGVVASVSCVAFAQDELASETNVELKKSDKSDGFHYTAALTAGASISDNSNVIGEGDGTTSVYNLKLSFNSVLIDGTSEWENNASLSETITQSPSMNDRVIKSGDELKLVSFYKKYGSQMKWLGYFGRVAVDAPLLDGYDERADAVNYSIARKNGEAESRTANRLKLTDGLRPMVIKESIGALAKVHDSAPLTVEFRTGPASKQILAGRQFSVADDDKTEDVIEIVELNYVRTTGIEFGLELKGKLLEKKIGRIRKSSG